MPSQPASRPSTRLDSDAAYCDRQPPKLPTALPHVVCRRAIGFTPHHDPYRGTTPALSPLAAARAVARSGCNRGWRCHSDPQQEGRCIASDGSLSIADNRKWLGKTSDRLPAHEHTLLRVAADCEVVEVVQRSPPESLERVPERLQDEGAAYPERYGQIAAVRFYLQKMLRDCGAAWEHWADGITNYRTLLARSNAGEATSRSAWSHLNTIGVWTQPC